MAIQPNATRSLRRVKVKTPGSRLVIHYLKRKPSAVKCGKCKTALKGIPRERPSGFRNLTLSQKTVSRAYGGNLCSKCSRETIINKFKEMKELPLEIGQVCVKTAGKEGSKICVVIDKIDDNFVMIDGQVKRRKCNILHLKTLERQIDIKKNENTENIKKEFGKLGYEIREKKKVAKEEKTPVKVKETKAKKIKDEKRSTRKVR